MATDLNKDVEPPFTIAVSPPGYRLPAAIRLGPVRLQVSDLPRSIAYYHDVFGLRVLEETGTTARLGTLPGAEPLIDLQARPGARPVPRRGRLGLYHYAILLPTRAALGRFLQHLARQGMYAGMADHGVSEAIYLTDPDGLGIEVYADRPRAAWPIRGSELTGGSEPLDIQGLLGEAGASEWAGMPEGTIIGHVHLHVGNLEQAAAFYHEALGLDKVRWNFPGALFLSAGGYHHHLGTNTWAAGAPAPTEADARLLEWQITLPTAAAADAAAQSLRNLGHQPQGRAGNWTVEDPWGTRLRLTSGE